MYTRVVVERVLTGRGRVKSDTDTGRDAPGLSDNCIRATTCSPGVTIHLYRRLHLLEQRVLVR